MATPKTNAIHISADGCARPVGEKLIARTYKIPMRHHNMLEQGAYKDNGGVLVRLLLEEYFADRCPSVKVRFNKLYQESQKAKGL